ncbi:MAG: Spy/CpxP family protein refolding chaperone [Pyrinomonadaceae bacterium]
MKKIVIGIITFALVAMGTIFVIGQNTSPDDDGDGMKFGRRGHKGPGGMRGPDGGGFEGFGVPMFKDLNLTDAQKTQIQSIMKEGAAQGKTLRDQMRDNQKAKQDSLDNGYDAAKIQELAQAQGALQSQMVIQRAEIQNKVSSVLTAEQKKKIADKKAEMKKKFEERRAKWEAKKASNSNQ